MTLASISYNPVSVRSSSRSEREREPYLLSLLLVLLLPSSTGLTSRARLLFSRPAIKYNGNLEIICRLASDSPSPPHAVSLSLFLFLTAKFTSSGKR